MKPFLLFMILLSSLHLLSQEIYVNAKAGNDKNTGSHSQPLKTISEAAKRINSGTTKGTATIILSEGVYPLTETVLFNNNKFSEKNRLTIRAEILPDDTAWNPQRMPIITSIITGTPISKDGEESRGLQVDVSHA